MKPQWNGRFWEGYDMCKDCYRKGVCIESVKQMCVNFCANFKPKEENAQDTNKPASQMPMRNVQ